MGDRRGLMVRVASDRGQIRFSVWRTNPQERLVRFGPTAAYELLDGLNDAILAYEEREANGNSR